MRAFDLIALDREDLPFLMLEAKGRAIPADAEGPILQQMWDDREGIPYGTRIRYGVLADPDTIRLYEFRDGRPTPLCSWSTPKILGHYAPEFPQYLQERFGVHGDYIAGLIGSWLRDLAYKWKGPTPPGIEDWRAAGILSKIEGGNTLSEVPIGFDALR